MAFRDLVIATFIVLLVIDIIGRTNSTYWYRKGFNDANKIMTDILTKMVDDTK